MYLLNLTTKLDEISQSVDKFFDKFTSNPAFAGIVAFVLFVFIYIGVSSFSKK